MFVSYGGSGAFNGIIFPFRWGMRPSACTLFGPPQSVAQEGPLLINNGTVVLFPNCVLQSVSDADGVMSVTIHDRRARLNGAPFRGEYNVPVLGGPDVKFEKTPREIANELFDLLGETGHDVSDLPNTARPYVRGGGRDARDVLESFCLSLGCRPVLRLNNKFSIVPIGDGASPGAPNSIADPTTAARFGAEPESIGIEFEPSVYQARLKLAAVEYDANDNLVDPVAATLSLPAPWIGFPSLTQPERRRAEKSMYRIYRIDDTHPDPLDVPGYGAINDIQQVFPVGGSLAAPVELNDYVTVAPARVVGKFFAGNYMGVTHATFEEYRHPFTIMDGGYIVFDRPVCKIGSDGVAEPCDELFLETAFHVRKDDATGEFERRIKTQSNNQDVNSLDRTFPSKMYARFVSEYNDTTGDLDITTDNGTEIDDEADKILAALSPAYEQKVAVPVMAGGIVVTEPGGIIEQVTWAAGLPTLDTAGGAPVTWIGGNCESYGMKS